MKIKIQRIQEENRNLNDKIESTNENISTYNLSYIYIYILIRKSFLKKKLAQQVLSNDPLFYAGL